LLPALLLPALLLPALLLPALLLPALLLPRMRTDGNRFATDLRRKRLTSLIVPDRRTSNEP